MKKLKFKICFIQDEDDQAVNSRTIKEFGDESKTLVPERDNDADGGTMIAHTNCETLVPDSGTMVELGSNLGTMVINSDSEDATMKGYYAYFKYIYMSEV